MRQCLKTRDGPSLRPVTMRRGSVSRDRLTITIRQCLNAYHHYETVPRDSRWLITTSCHFEARQCLKRQTSHHYETVSRHVPSLWGSASRLEMAHHYVLSLWGEAVSQEADFPLLWGSVSTRTVTMRQCLETRDAPSLRPVTMSRGSVSRACLDVYRHYETVPRDSRWPITTSCHYEARQCLKRQTSHHYEAVSRRVPSLRDSTSRLEMAHHYVLSLWGEAMSQEADFPLLWDSVWTRTITMRQCLETRDGPSLRPLIMRRGSFSRGRLPITMRQCLDAYRHYETV